MRLYAFGRAHHPAYRQKPMYTQGTSHSAAAGGTGRSMCNVRAARPFLSRRTTAFVCNVGERDGLSFLFYCFCLDLLLLPVFLLAPASYAAGTAAASRQAQFSVLRYTNKKPWEMKTVKTKKRISVAGIVWFGSFFCSGGP